MYRLGPPTPVSLLKLGTSPPTVELQLQAVINVWMKAPMVSLFPYYPLVFSLFLLVYSTCHLTSFRSEQYSSVCYYHRGPLLIFQVLRLINVPLEIPIKVSPSIPRHLLTSHHLLIFQFGACSHRNSSESPTRWLLLALLIHTSSLSLADIKPGPSSPKPQPHPHSVSSPTSPRERSTPTPLLVVESESILMEGTISV